MSNKLSTSQIKEFMKSWLQEQTMEYNWIILQAKDQEKQKLIELWTNPNNWKRHSKSRVGCQIFQSRNYETNTYEPYFDIDDSGWCDKELVEKYSKDDKMAKRCWHRTFIPADEFADNYHMEVYSTPEDDKIIGWTIYVD